MRSNLAENAPPEPAVQELMVMLAAATGNARLSGTSSPVLNEVRLRLAETGVGGIDAYLSLLRDPVGGRQEMDTLIARLTVGETFFFRQPEHFAALRDVVLPACMERNAASRQLRIWSAGCANGAEAYSIALTLNAALGEGLGGWKFIIVGSDINRAFLKEAEAGVYTAWTLRGVEDKEREAFFEKVPEGWRLRDRYRHHVRFVRHNLVRDAVPSISHGIHDCDIVFCRNVLLYFDDESRRHATANIERAMVDGAFMFVAPTDVNPQLEQTFASAKLRGVEVYRKGKILAEPVRLLPKAAAVRRDSPAADVRPPRRPSPPGEPARKRAAPARAAGQSPALAAILAHADRGDFATAARLAAALIEAEPLNAFAYYVKALVAEGCGGSEEAEASLRRAIYLDRSLAIAHYHLALLRVAAGDRSAAHRGFLNVVDLLTAVSNTQPASPDGEVDAGTLRALALHQLERLSAR